ncbi:hypothetical protein [Paenibacillus chitinolyticus]
MKITKNVVLLDAINDIESREIVDTATLEVMEAINKLKSPIDADGFYFHPDSKARVVNKKRIGGNGVKPLKEPFLETLKQLNWVDEFPSQTKLDVIVKIRALKNAGTSKSLIYGTVISIDRENERIVYKNKTGEEVFAVIDAEFESDTSDDDLIGKFVSMTTATPGDLDLCKFFGDRLVAIEWETGNISSSHRALNKMALLLLHGHIHGGVLVVPNRNMGKYLTDRIGNYEELRPYFGLWRSVPIISGHLQIIVIEHDGTDEKAPFLTKGNDGLAEKQDEEEVVSMELF